jgi:anti-sigma-K factor RskA
VSDANQEQLRELASLHALGVLSAEERAELATAMAADAELAAEVRLLEDTAGALGGVVAQVDPPARLRARVLAVAGIEADPAAVAPGISVVGGRSGTRTSDAPAPARAGSRGVAGWLAAAAALVLASGLGLWALQLRTSLDAMNARVDRAEAEVVRIQRTLNEAQQQTRVLQAHNSVLFAPDTLRVDLAGEGPAPGSKARAFMSRHSGVVLVADQLPALPADKVYQLWVVPVGAAPVSAGLLAPDPTGHAALFFPMPADVTAPQALAVTVEPAGGLPAPSGSRVLLGAVPAGAAS